MKSIYEATNLSGKKALVVVDFNVPVVDGRVASTFRIRRSLPTIKFLRDAGARVILVSHFGKSNEDISIILPALTELIVGLEFADRAIISPETRGAIDSLQDGGAVLLSNIRSDKGEVANSDSFARELASYADIYVNEAFSVCHREHASIVGLPKYLPSFAGLELLSEVEYLSQVGAMPKPLLCILGGAKFSTKIPVLEKFLTLADAVFIGGALANEFLKKKGLPIGQSLFEDVDFDFARALANNKLHLPTDVEVSNCDNREAKAVEAVGESDRIVDIGSTSVEELKKLIAQSQTVFWNGPLGVYEEGFAKATEETLLYIASQNIKSIIGGGDTEEIVEKMSLEDKFTFVSCGGGAALEYLALGTLPGLKALG